MSRLAPLFLLLGLACSGATTPEEPPLEVEPPPTLPDLPVPEVFGVLADGSGHCLTTERLLFECQAEGGKWISLCVSASFPEPASELQYRFGPKGAAELVFPEDPTLWRSSFRWGKVAYARSEAYELTFEQDGYKYVVFDQDTLGTELDHGSGVSVRKDGKILPTVGCEQNKKLAMDNLESVLPELR